jgi:hypothetical protein
MLLFCFGLWSLAQDIPGPGDDSDGPPVGSEPTYIPNQSADGDHPGWDDGPAYHDPVPPKLAGVAPHPPLELPAPATATVAGTVGTTGNATAPATATAKRDQRHDIPAGMRYPGRVAPSKQIASGTRSVDWTFLFDGEVHHVHTDIAIDPGDGLRRPAHVSTFDDQGNLLVQYDGTAFLDKDGIAQVDARNSAITGPMADQWSPDSFAIDQYGYMHSLDDQLQTGSGWRTGGPGAKQ